MHQWIIGIVATIAVGFLIKKVPQWLADEEGKLLDEALKAGTPADDELLLAFVKWAEAKIPQPGSGHDKYVLVAEKISSAFPILPADKIDELIENAVTKMEEEANKRSHQP